MPSSRKKGRGNRRKAPQSFAGRSDDRPIGSDDTATAHDDTSAAAGIEHEGIRRIKNSGIILRPAASIVEGVRRGSEEMTLAVAFDLCDRGHRVQENLIKEGLLDVVLGLLRRCENESFASVIADVEGDLGAPSAWLHILSMNAECFSEECQLQICLSLGPVLRCMCNDNQRQFFKRNRSWHEAIIPFAMLVEKLFESRDNSLILLGYDGMLETIIQWVFWNTHRHDILKESIACGYPPEYMAPLPSLGWELLYSVINRVMTDSSYKVFSKGMENLLQSIAKTPIVSRTFDPQCNVPSIAGLIPLWKICGDRLFSCLDAFICNAGAVDEYVIQGVIDHGLRCPNDYYHAVNICEISYKMLLKKTADGHYQPSDTRIASAVHTGLLEMCFRWIAVFKDSTQNEALLKSLTKLLNCVHAVSLHKKSAKAIGQRWRKVLSMSRTLRKIPAFAKEKSCTDFLSMMKEILQLNAVTCSRCNTLIERNVMKLCGGCGRVAYCSRVCQEEDWNDGHSLICEREQYGDVRFKGQNGYPVQSSKDTKIAELVDNISLIQERLFRKNESIILRQLKSRKLNPSESIVIFNLCQIRPQMKVMPYSSWRSTELPKVIKERDSYGPGIACGYLSYFFNGQVDRDGDSQNIILYKSFQRKDVEQRRADMDISQL